MDFHNICIAQKWKKYTLQCGLGLWLRKKKLFCFFHRENRLWQLLTWGGICVQWQIQLPSLTDTQGFPNVLFFFSPRTKLCFSVNTVVLLTVFCSSRDFIANSGPNSTNAACSGGGGEIYLRVNGIFLFSNNFLSWEQTMRSPNLRLFIMRIDRQLHSLSFSS